MKQIRTVLAVLTIALLSFGCGGASNNDQGVSFTLYGFFSPADDTTGVVGSTVVIGADQEAEGSLGAVFVDYGLQNNLTDQGIRTQRIFLSFYIEGAEAAFQPPPTTVPLGVVLGPGTVSGTSSLPPAFNFPNSTIAESLIIPPDTLEYINLNRQHFPELPFAMTVTASVVGISTSGNQYETNELNYIAQFVADQVISPTPGDGDTGDTTGGATETSETGTVNDTPDTETEVGETL